MRVRILPSAINDLEAGKDFYESQSPGLGGYFQDSLFTDIDSLFAIEGFTARSLAFIACGRSAFRLPSTIELKAGTLPWFTGCLIAGVIPCAIANR